MSFACIYSAQPVYLKAKLVTIEVDLSNGIHSFSIVGLPDKAVEESKERVSAAIKNSGFKSPKHGKKKVLISLAPANLQKEGTRFDLPIALAYLLASKEVDFDTNGLLFFGELSLKGDLRPITGALSLAKFAKDNNFHTIILPQENAREAALVKNLNVLPAKNLSEIVNHFDKIKQKENPQYKIQPQKHTKPEHIEEKNTIDFGEIKGQETAKRGLEIAAAGRHNISLYGPPGTGKTMLAKAFRGILPNLSFEEAIEATEIHSIAGTLKDTIITTPPFRAPHHTSSHVAIVGGGSTPKPGEVTLAHRGVLFLDEFPEFEKRVIDVLREPLEDKIVSISRAKGSVSFPANFILVTALNPNRGDVNDRISEVDKERLKKKISGPVIDRIDMWIEVSNVDYEKMKIDKNKNEKISPKIKKRITEARGIQKKRYGNSKKTNSDMSVKDINKYANLSQNAENILKKAAEAHNLSPRSYHRTIKLARTIADLDAYDEIKESHILEALTYRPKDIFD
jgi:magnesium chelatase family protein